MTSEGLGEMFEGDSAGMCAEKFLLVSMGGRVEGLACADPGARTPTNTNYCSKLANVVKSLTLILYRRLIVLKLDVNLLSCNQYNL